jgi:hypothetical protein
MELHPEQRFEIARQRQAEKLAHGLEAYRALRAQEESATEESARSPRRLVRFLRATVRPMRGVTSRQHQFHAIAVLAVVIGIVSAVAGSARSAYSGNPTINPGQITPAPAPQHHQAATPAALAAAEAAHQRALAEQRSAAEGAEAARSAGLNEMYERQRREAEEAERIRQQPIQAPITGVGGGGYGQFYAD